jgi:hypothetical protein
VGIRGILAKVCRNLCFDIALIVSGGAVVTSLGMIFLIKVFSRFEDK